MAKPPMPPLEAGVEGTRAVVRHSGSGAIEERDTMPTTTNGSGNDPNLGDALKELASYPVLTEQVGARGQRAGLPGADLGARVRKEIKEVIGFAPTGSKFDNQAFEAALKQSFKIYDTEG